MDMLLIHGFRDIADYDVGLGVSEVVSLPI